VEFLREDVTVTARIFDEPGSLGFVHSLTLSGRYMLPDMTEMPCQVTDITKTGANFICNAVPAHGLNVVAYLEDLGRLEGVTGGAVKGGFQVEFSMQGPRLEKFHARVALLQQKFAGHHELREHARYEPRDKKSQITLPDGRVYACEVVDISVSGAAVKVEVLPQLGTFIMLGKMRGRVVRYLENGVALEFIKTMTPQNVSLAV
jgi:PilZ domain